MTETKDLTSVTHSGERELHARLGRAERQEEMMRRMVRPFMPDQHRTFYTQLPFLVLGSVDGAGRPWASMVFGTPGFVTTPDAVSLRIDAVPVPGDPLAENAVPGAPVSLLGIELPTRRRNRVNGIFSDSGRGGIDIGVVASFGNCPQHIHTRSVEFTRDPRTEAPVERRDFTALDAETADFIRRAETLFVASHNPHEDPRRAGGVDVNHRGGRPGFVKVEGDTLTVPEFRGNFAFNTLGNFLVHPRAGLLFADFETGDLLTLTGRTELVWDLTPEFAAFAGAERGWRFTVEEGRWLRGASPLRGTFIERSPTSVATATWAEAAERRDESSR